MQNEISIQKIRQDAEELFRSGGFYCSEALVYAIRKNIDPGMPEGMVAAASGFPVGIGRTKCACGAVTGGVLALGYFFGRTEPTNPKDPASVQCLALCAELSDSFRENHKNVLCCKVQTQGMDMASGEHKAQCIQFTGEMAAKVAEIVAREKGLTVTE